MGGGRVGMSATATNLQNKVIHGDCLEVMPTLPDKSIDMILCDLPYGTTACKWDSVIPFEPLWKQYKRLIKDNGAIVLTANEPFASLLRVSNLNNYKYDWIWNKVKTSSPTKAKYSPLKQHEAITVFSYDNHRYFPIMVKRPNIKKRTTFTSSDSAPLSKHDGKDRYYDQWYPKTILEFSNANQRGRLHPTQKPVALFEYLIKTYTNEGETVLDNCAGSGTTAIACLNTNRNYILIEQEQNYIEIINKRISEHEIQVSIC